MRFMAGHGADDTSDNETGRVNAIFPGSSLHYCQVIEEPRYEDYNITYQNKHNP
jgi:hydroxyversicolorone monooxygenase